MDQRLSFEVWKIRQLFDEPTRLAKENGVLAQPVEHSIVPAPVSMPVPASIPAPPSPPPLQRVLSARASVSYEGDSTNELETLERLVACKERGERIPFVLAWSIVYHNLLLGRSQTPSNAFYSLKKINTQEKLEDELNKSGLLDANDMVDIEGLIILDHVFLGSRVHAKDKECLLALGITHILNVTPARTVDPVAGVPNFFEKDPSFTYGWKAYRRCALFDNQGEDILTSIEGCVAFIDQAKYYVHCKQGVSRSASIVVAYVMKTQQLCRDDALAFVQARRPEPNAGFLKQLRQYEARLNRTHTKQAAVGPALPPHLLPKATPIGPQRPPILSAASPVSPSPTCASTCTPLAIGPQLPSKARRSPADAIQGRIKRSKVDTSDTSAL
ncbi:hypothetical protein ACHHYP_16854 [Achlya hypogyna]|uniref:protein-tyrosine-phosphatase n=1 Tax=Achlya hypogyna TaxID=1202772 RepID=A0A1V9Y5L6_ACHHY|nr:hypothetical protein ACHHYP_16854 [Achlya hypogyna]